MQSNLKEHFARLGGEKDKNCFECTHLNYEKLECVVPYVTQHSQKMKSVIDYKKLLKSVEELKGYGAKCPFFKAGRYMWEIKGEIMKILEENLDEALDSHELKSRLQLKVSEAENFEKAFNELKYLYGVNSSGAQELSRDAERLGLGKSFLGWRSNLKYGTS